MGIAKGTFYYYFKTKEDVFHEIIDEGVAQLYLLMNASIKKTRNKRGKKSEKLSKLRSISLNNTMIFVWSLWVSFGATKIDGTKIFRRFKEKYMDLINKIFGENNKQKVKGAVLFWLGATMSLHWQTFCTRNQQKNLY